MYANATRISTRAFQAGAGNVSAFSLAFTESLSSWDLVITWAGVTVGGGNDGRKSGDSRWRARQTKVHYLVDNVTEFYSKALDQWSYKNGVVLHFIRPGRLVENGYIESFNGKLRDECLNLHLFFSLADAEENLAQWRKEYNDERPHSALAGLPPKAYAQTLCRNITRTITIADS